MKLNQIKNEIEIIESYLSQEELNKDIITVQNKELANFLESVGKREIKYQIPNHLQWDKFTELSGVTNLWYKDVNGNWIIKYYEIKRFFR